MMFLVAATLYLIVLLVVGVWRGRGVRTEDDFMVAGRRIPAGVLVGTLLATWIGAGSVLGAAGLAYRYGLPALWFSAGAWLAIALLIPIAGRARAFAQYTVPDILEARYNAVARVLGAIVTVVAYTAIVSYQFRAGGLVLEAVADVDPGTGVLITAAAVVAYTAVAGLVSVAYTDVVNGVVLTVGMAVTFVWLLVHEGGPVTAAAALPPEKVSLLGELSVPQVLGIALPPLALLLGEANMYQRFFSAESEGAARRAVVGWIAGTILVESLIVGVAVLGSLALPDLDAAGASGAESIVLRVLRDVLPPALGALLLAAVLAIIVSTADSFLLVPATNVMRDVIQRFLRPALGAAAAVRLLRVIVVLLGLFAWAQLRFFESVLQMALYAYTMYGAGITPAVLAAFFWRRATAAGGVASVAAGMAATLLWEGLRRAGGLPAAVAELDTVFFALTASVAALVLVSLATPPPDQRLLEPFYRRGRAPGAALDAPAPAGGD